MTFKLQDAMTTDVSQATVVTLYLLSSSNLKLRPILTRQLKPGARIVAHNFAHGRLGGGEDRDLPGQGRAVTDDLSVDGGREGAAVGRLPGAANREPGRTGIPGSGNRQPHPATGNRQPATGARRRNPLDP